MDAFKVLNSRYQLLTVIKRGGLGTIYKGYDSVLGKDIAVKEINRELLEKAWYVEQFKNEARHVAKMNHQNIVHIFDLVQAEDGQFYIIMEYIDGMDLGKLLQESSEKEEPIPQHLTVHIVAEVCKALDYAHNCRNTETHEALNLVHQDISPGNIVIAKTGSIKLIDFGIANVHRQSISDKNYLMLQGKVQYMSPEHVSTEQKLDRRSDIFSLGLVLYELLEGRRFFQKEDLWKIVEILRNGKLKLKDFLVTPKALQKVVQKALERDPQNRYQNANQFYIDLVTYLVTNTDSTAIDAELAKLVLDFTGHEETPQEATPVGEEFDLTEQMFIEESETDATKEKAPIENKDDWELEFDELEKVHEQFQKEEEAPASKTPVFETPTFEMPVSTQEKEFQNYYESGDEIKTVIDVVRLSARGHKKLILRSFTTLVGLSLLFFLLDLAFQWTHIGAMVYDSLFPPAIKIASVPAGATVYLNNESLAGKTPIGIDKIKPGVYGLKLTMDGYHPITKSMHIPSKGQIEIAGENDYDGSAFYSFKFKTILELDSTPPNADVFINGIRYGQKTPCSLTWEVGDPCKIDMKLAGYNDIGGFSLDSEKMVEEIDDRRLWHFEIEKEPTISYQIRGRFGKNLVIHSKPPGAEIYIDENPVPVGKTDEALPVFLTAANHKITLLKDGYNAKVVKVKIDKNTPAKISEMLSRPVKLSAYDATDGKTQNLDAIITKLERNGKTVLRNKRTPVTLDLLPYTYTATFTKKGYQSTQVKISPEDNLVTVLLEPLTGSFSVVVLDQETQQPLSNVEVRLKSLDNPDTFKERLEVTDAEGTCSGVLEPGLYLFRTSKNDYAYQEKSIMIQTAELNLLEFNLAKSQ